MNRSYTENNVRQTILTGSRIVQVMCLSCAVLYAAFPPLRALGGSAVVTNLCCLLWVCAVMAEDCRFFLSMPCQRLTTAVFAVYTAVAPRLAGNGVIANRYITLAQVLFYYIAYEYYARRGNRRVIRLVALFCAPFFLYTSVITLWGLQSVPFLARSVKNSGEYTLDLFRKGVDGYDLIYAGVFVFILAAYFAFRRKRPVLFMLAILMGWLVVASNYLTALVAAAGALALMAVGGWICKSGPCTRVLAVILAAICLLFAREITLSTVRIAASAAKSGLTHERLVRTGEELAKVERLTVMDTRLEDYRKSIRSFRSAPLVGIALSPVKSDEEPILERFSQHSAVLDTYALYGAVWGTIYIYVSFQPLWKRVIKGRRRLLSAAMLLAFTIVAILDNLTPSIGIAVYFLFPYLADGP